METRTLETPQVDLVHDVAGPLPTADGRPPVVFPSHHGGFGPEDGPWPGQATAFAATLRAALM